MPMVHLAVPMWQQLKIATKLQMIKSVNVETDVFSSTWTDNDVCFPMSHVGYLFLRVFMKAPQRECH